MVTTKTTEINWEGKADYTVALAFRVETNSKGSPNPLLHKDIISINCVIIQGWLVIVKHYKNIRKEELKEKEMTSRKESWHLS